MLKFATKKPPRLKHSDQVSTSAHLDQHGRGLSDEGAQYMSGDFKRFEKINGDDMIDSSNQYREFERPMQNNRTAYSEDKENLGQQRHGNLSPPHVQWKAYNVKYGKIGVEKEIEYHQEERQVGFIRNGRNNISEGSRSQGLGQRAQFNPGFMDNTLENRKPYDVNRNVYSDGLSDSDTYSKGSGYRYPVSEGQLDQVERSRSNLNVHQNNAFTGYGKKRQFESLYPTSPRLAHENPFPLPHLTADSSSHYGPAGSLDSTASMSIDSMSTSGDRSSKSVSDNLDYDVIMDMPQVTKRGLEHKPPMPHKHHHVHVGRGTHGICEPSPSPTRPGSSDSHITSSLRKSPSGLKSGHHVRWGPGVVNSHQNIETQMSRSPMISGPPVAKKGKKKTSLRTLLNLPKFPMSDDESDHSVDLTQSDYLNQNYRKEPKGASDTAEHRGTLRKLLDYRSKKKPLMAQSQPLTTSTELASLRYKQDNVMVYSPGQKSEEKGHQMKLNITQANLLAGISNGYDGTFWQDYDTVQETGAVRYPIMHAGKDQSIFRKEPQSRSPVNSVRPFLINGQSSEIQDYDNFSETESQPQKSQVISVKSEDKNKVNALHQGNNSKTQLYDKKPQTTNVFQSTPPFTTATFDTYVTLGRPTESSVTFDTFVTHGRPYATSTPIPNGNFGNIHNLGQETSSVDAFGKSDLKRNYTHTSGSLIDPHGQVDSSVTQSWTYSSPGTQQHSSVPFVTQPVQASTREPVMHTRTDLTSSERSQGHASALGSPGPYQMENRVYGQLSGPSADRVDNSKYKDSCTYHEKDTGDYDDDVFLTLGLTPDERSRTVRRKLDFEGSSNGPVRFYFCWHDDCRMKIYPSPCRSFIGLVPIRVICYVYRIYSQTGFRGMIEYDKRLELHVARFYVIKKHHLIERYLYTEFFVLKKQRKM